MAIRPATAVAMLSSRPSPGTKPAHCTSVAQKPLMQRFLESQQSEADLQASLCWEHRGVGGRPQTWLVQKPLQQSTPVSQLSPSVLHGSRAVNARWFAV